MMRFLSFVGVGLGRCVWLVVLGLVLCGGSWSVLGCATCYGVSDSPLAAGMNWGMLMMVGVVYFVVFGIVGFFVFLGWRRRGLGVGSGGCGVVEKSE